MSSQERLVRIPLDNRALEDIESLLAESDVFTTTFQHLGEKVFRAETYIRERLDHGTQFVVLIDRNLLTRLVSLSRGEVATHAHRVAAAVLSFAQTTDSLVEPNMALYEVAATGGGNRALDELAEFRRLDDSHPQLFADIAVGRSDRLEVEYLSEKARGESVDLTRPLRRWRANYTAALKIATLELAPASAEKKMLTLMAWMQDEFLLIAPALCLASRYLAPNGPRKRLLKNLRSADRTRALAGIRNAAWDLALASEWGARVREQGDGDRLWILATLDRGLHEIARSLVAPAETDQEVAALIRAEFIRLWGADRGRRVDDAYRELLRRPISGASPVRALTSEEATQMIRSLEAEVLEHGGTSV